jgi:cytochrome c oxidase subunit 2
LNQAPQDSRRQWLKGVAAWSALPLAVFWGARARSSDTPARVVKITAQRFKYTPNEVLLKPGEAVQLEITSLDFIHGFSIPELKMRADLPPGRVTTVRVQFGQEGVYDFLCDNFCGDKHEEMSGKFLVEA